VINLIMLFAWENIQKTKKVEEELLYLIDILICRYTREFQVAHCYSAAIESAR